MNHVVRSPHNYQVKDYSGMTDEEVGYGPSDTVPDQALSLQELLHNYTRGIPVPSYEGEYLGEDFVPDFNSMDLSEIHEYKLNLVDEIKDIKQKMEIAEQEAYQKRNQPKDEPKVVEPTQPVENEDVT